MHNRNRSFGRLIAVVWILASSGCAVQHGPTTLHQPSRLPTLGVINIGYRTADEHSIDGVPMYPLERMPGRFFPVPTRPTLVFRAYLPEEDPPEEIVTPPADPKTPLPTPISTGSPADQSESQPEPKRAPPPMPQATTQPEPVAEPPAELLAEPLSPPEAAIAPSPGPSVLIRQPDSARA